MADGTHDPRASISGRVPKKKKKKKPRIAPRTPPGRNKHIEFIALSDAREKIFSFNARIARPRPILIFRFSLTPLVSRVNTRRSALSIPLRPK